MPQSGRLGFRVLAAPPRVDATLLDRFRGLASPNLADAMGRFNFMDAGIRSRSGFSMCGLAVTVSARPADNLMIHKAMQVAQSGDVVVVNTCGNTTSAVFGELMCTTAAAAKLGGIVVDGAIRDVDGITEARFPRIQPHGLRRRMRQGWPRRSQRPHRCGGTVVMPGDIIVGDGDGVVVVPRDNAEDVLTLVQQLMERERKRIAEINAGTLFRPDVDDLLRKKGVIE